MVSNMKNQRKVRLFIYLSVSLLSLLLLTKNGVSGQNYIEYKVQIDSDGSAVWMIMQFSSINGTVDTWEGFQEKILNAVDSATSQTHRSMIIDENSLQINTIISSETKTTEYSFRWQNFSTISGEEILFGDVFELSKFFAQLYGDASLQVIYPSTYNIKSITPVPYERNDQAKTFRWSRTQDLANSNPNIILTKTQPSEIVNSSEEQLYVVTGAVVTTASVVSLVGLYAFKRRKKNGKQQATLVGLPSIESEEEKVIKVLSASGGSMRQSAVTEQCRFSKAKTSQLLAALEIKGIVTRYKKGRDKIVILKERVKE